MKPLNKLKILLFTIILLISAVEVLNCQDKKNSKMLPNQIARQIYIVDSIIIDDPVLIRCNFSKGKECYHYDLVMSNSVFQTSKDNIDSEELIYQNNVFLYFSQTDILNILSSGKHLYKKEITVFSNSISDKTTYELRMILKMFDKLISPIISLPFIQIPKVERKKNGKIIQIEKYIVLPKYFLMLLIDVNHLNKMKVADGSSFKIKISNGYIKCIVPIY